MNGDIKAAATGSVVAASSILGLTNDILSLVLLCLSIALAIRQVSRPFPRKKNRSRANLGRNYPLEDVSVSEESED